MGSIEFVDRRQTLTTFVILVAMILVITLLALPSPAAAQSSSPTPAAAPDLLTLYRDLRAVPLDADRTYHVREAAIDREELHLYLNDGTIGFTRDVAGHITGAFYEGDGQVLLRPPDLAERTSLGLFTQLGILDEKFTSAYLRFNDDTFQQLQPYMLKIDTVPTFAADNERVTTSLASMDALRLLGTFSSDQAKVRDPDKYFHARLNGRLGTFDVVYDSLGTEQFLVGGLRQTPAGESVFDMWMAFNGGRVRRMSDKDRSHRLVDPWRAPESVRISTIKVDSKLLPPEQIEATADLDLTVIDGGQRLLIFELSRYLRVQSVQMDNAPATFLQNEAISGSDLSRRGNDLVSVLTPRPLKPGQQLHLRFHYAGPVMSKAAEGLLFVGERGTWYPSRGISMSNFQLRFHWPEEWTLVASGKRISLDAEGDELVGEWRSEGVVPLAGFNLGKYVHSSARAGSITVDTFATAAVEQSLTAKVPGQRPPPRKTNPGDILVVLPPDKLDPSQGAQSVADTVGKAVAQYSQWYGPYPYSSLSLTQFPAPSSQGWPSLIFLASSSFLSREERAKLPMSPFARVLYGETMQTHETAHQWWGDLVGWKTYRDQWISEAVANYSALMLLEETRPEDMRFLLDTYRTDLERKNRDGRPYLDAGPITLGFRLNTSVFPDAYIVVTYGRGTWLMHMLRSMLHDPAAPPAMRDARYIAALRSLRDTYARKEIGLDDFRKAFEAKMPESLEFQNQHSLTWFFDGWVQGSAVPKIELKDVKINPKGAQGSATFTITQEDCPDDLVTLIPIYAVNAAGARTFAGRIFADGHETKDKLSVPAGTRKLLLDPDQTILRRLN
jgi:Peptidase family M1 domain